MIRGLYALHPENRFVWLPFASIKILEYVTDKQTKIYTDHGCFYVAKDLSTVVDLISGKSPTRLGCADAQEDCIRH